MFKIIFFIVPLLLALAVTSVKFGEDKESITKPEFAEKKSEHDIRVLQRESKQLRKAKRFKERKALENVVSAKNGDGHRDFFGDQDSAEKSVLPQENKIHNFVITNKYVNNDKNEGTNSSDVGEAEVERISGNKNKTNYENRDASRLPNNFIFKSGGTKWNSSDKSSKDTNINSSGKSSSDTDIRRNAPTDSHELLNLNTKGRTGHPSVSEIADSLLFGGLRDRRLLEPLAHFNTAADNPQYGPLTRRGMALNPVMHTMPTSSINHAPYNRATDPEKNTGSSSKSDVQELVKFIDDYVDSNTNNYNYASRRSNSNEMIPKVIPNVLPKSADSLLLNIQPINQPHFPPLQTLNPNNQMLSRDRMYPTTTFFPQAYRFPGGLRPYYRLHP